MENKMDIAFIADENFILPTSVAVASLINNNNYELQIHIITPGVSSDSMKKLKSLETKNAKIKIYDVDNEDCRCKSGYLYLNQPDETRVCIEKDECNPLTHFKGETHCEEIANCTGKVGDIYYDTTTNECGSDCKEGLLLDSENKKCIESCGDNKLYDTVNKKCVSACTTEAPYKVVNESKCYEKCPDEIPYYDKDNDNLFHNYLL